MTGESKLQWIYTSKNKEELEQRYDVWAGEYDNDLDELLGWLGPKVGVEVFARHVPQSAVILDAGVGTGLVGVELKGLGYTDITGMDMSQGMLDEAAKKGLYRQLDQMVMGEKLDYADGAFDAVISIGVLTLGHAPAESLDELVRVTKSGGHVAFSLRPDVYEERGFKEKQSALEAAGRWELVEVSDKVNILPKREPPVEHQVWVYRVCPDGK